jgi:hypothetical protein
MMAMLLKLLSNYYQAAVFEKAGSAATVVYDNVTFSVDGGALKYKLDNGGSTFFTILTKCRWWNSGR